MKTNMVRRRLDCNGQGGAKEALNEFTFFSLFLFSYLVLDVCIVFL